MANISLAGQGVSAVLFLVLANAGEAGRLSYGWFIEGGLL